MVEDVKPCKIDDVEGVDASYHRLAHTAPAHFDDAAEDAHGDCCLRRKECELAPLKKIQRQLQEVAEGQVSVPQCAS